jgi:hypothetical protein
VQLPLRVDEPERRVAEARGRDEALGLGRGEESIEAPGLTALDEERPRLAVLLEEALRLDRCEAER